MPKKSKDSYKVYTTQATMAIKWIYDDNNPNTISYNFHNNHTTSYLIYKYNQQSYHTMPPKVFRKMTASQKTTRA